MKRVKDARGSLFPDRESSVVQTLRREGAGLFSISIGKQKEGWRAPRTVLGECPLSPRWRGGG